MRGFFRRKAPEQSGMQGPTNAGSVVLIVEDSPTEMHIYAKALSKAGFRVETAYNGEEGVHLARRLLPDLVVMDIVMPVLNGYQATRELQKDTATAHIPVIIVSSKDQETDRAWGMRQGAVDYLTKPIDPDELVARIRTVLGG